MREPPRVWQTTDAENSPTCPTAKEENSESHEGLAQAVESAHIELKDRRVDDNTRVSNLSGSEKLTDGPEAPEGSISSDEGGEAQENDLGSCAQAKSPAHKPQSLNGNPTASILAAGPPGDRRSVSETNDPQNDLPVAAEFEPQSRAEEEKDPSANGVGSRIGCQKEREDRDAEGDSTDDDVVEVAAFSESDGVRVLVPPL